MARDVTVTFEDGTSNVYKNTPDDITPMAVQTRAEKDFSKKVTEINGGRKLSEIPAPRAEPSFMDRLLNQSTGVLTPSPQTVGNVAAGLARGAGSIGATLLAPADYIAGKIAEKYGEIPFVTGRDENRRIKMTEALRTMGAQPESLAFQSGQIGGEVAGTLPIGGILGRGVTAVAPRVAAPLATALETGGFSTGAMTAAQRAAAGLAPATVLQGAGNLAARATGGAVTGAAGSALVNPADAETGAVIGAALPTVGASAVKLFAKGGGWLWDAVTGKLGEVKAGEIARRVAGGDLAAIRAANAVAEQGLTSGQAAAGIDNAAWSALDATVKKQNTGSVYSRIATAQEAPIANELARLTGGATATESNAVRRESKNALNAITTPMRDTSLERAGIAGAVQPGLEQTVAAAEKGAAAKVEDVRRFTAAQDRWDEWAKTWTPTTTRDTGQSLLPRYAKDHPQFQQTFPGQLAQKAEEVATGAAESSLRLGELARDAKASIANLKAQGLQPLKSDSLISSLNARLADPDIATNTHATRALTQVRDMFANLSDQFGVITPQAAYAIRKNGVTSALADFQGSEDAKRKLAQTVLMEVRPLIDDAIERAGGIGWRNYLKTFEQGMHGIEEKKMAAVARQLYESGDKKGFVNLIRGNNPKAVEDIFGPGKDNFIQEMGGQRPKSPALDFMRLADTVDRELKLATQASEGGQEVAKIISDAAGSSKYLPSMFSAKITILRQGMKEFEGKVSKSALSALEKGMVSGATANELLATVPTSERWKVLNIMQNSARWNPAVGAATRQGAVNALAPSEPQQNRLNTYGIAQ
jgi:hypothetical protein